jgi:hypothetical protein
VEFADDDRGANKQDCCVPGYLRVDSLLPDELLTLDCLALAEKGKAQLQCIVIL